MVKIYLLGSERSGSNLLRTLLGNHSKLSAPIAPHFIDNFINQYQFYLPLTPESKTQLLKDLESYVNHSFNIWNLKLDTQNVINNYPLNSFVDFVDALYSEKAKAEGKSAYFSKDNHNHRYALGILKSLPTAKFIYLYRDPRDQVASWLRKPVHLHTPFQAARKWANEQKDIKTLKEFYNVDMHFVKYEDLVDDPVKVISDALNYLNLEVEEACFTTKADNKEAAINPLWDNINKPIKKKNYGKYRDVLDEKSLNLVEYLCGPMMDYLDYQKETKADWERGNRYLHFAKDKLKDIKSRKKNKKFMNEEMSSLRDKQRFLNELFSKFNKK